MSAAAAAVIVACCWAGPVLLAGGALGAIGHFLGNVVVVIAGAALAGAGALAIILRRHNKPRCGSGVNSRGAPGGDGDG